MDIKEKAKEKITTLKKELEKSGINSLKIEEKKYNYEFIATLDKDKIKVQVYFGKKGVKIVLQGNKNAILYNEIEQIITEQTQMQFAENNTVEPDEYIGSDESGKGDVFGPLITTAFYVNNKIKHELIAYGVKDSKELSETQITNIAKLIRKNFPDNFASVVLNPEKYNKLYNSFNNLNILLTWTHSKAISELLNKYKCKHIIVDKFSNRELNISGENYDNDVDIFQTAKGERFIGVAAASIIARDTFNKWFDKKSEKYFKFPKGASNIVDEELKYFVKKYSKNELIKVTKTHFKNVKKYLF